MGWRRFFRRECVGDVKESKSCSLAFAGCGSLFGLPRLVLWMSRGLVDVD